MNFHQLKSMQTYEQISNYTIYLYRHPQDNRFFSSKAIPLIEAYVAI